MFLSTNPLVALLAGALIFVALIGIIALVVYILYLLSLQNALKKVSSQNRTVEPGLVWLMLIPIVGFIYCFILYPKISESLKNEFEARNMPQSGDYGKMLGLILAISGPVQFIGSFLPFLNIIIGLAAFVIWIMYWAKISGLKNRLS